MACLYMKKHIAKLFAFAVIMLGFTLLLSVSAMASDPLNHSIEVTPNALTGMGTVRVQINIVNMSDDGNAMSVTLLDPDGNVCSGFGSGGTANLSPGASQSYSGNWSVTQKQLDAGKITFSARYTVTDEAGNKVPATRPIAANITYSQANAKLNIERFVEPAAKVLENQTVTIRYSIKNTGTLDITDITIEDPEIIKDPVVLPRLAVGETDEISYSFVAGSTSKVTQASIKYKYVNGDKTVESKPTKIDKPVTIDVTVANLVIQLSGTQIVNPGDKVDLTYVITNKSDLSYEQLKITDTILNDIDSNLSLGPTKTYTGKKSITVNTTGTYQFTLTGVDSTGQNIIVQSNELTIQTTDMIEDSMLLDVIPVNLDIVIEGDRDIIYREPSEILFHIKVTNNDETEIKDVVIGTAGKYGKAIKTIDKIAAGETVDFIMPFNASMGGQYQFTATAKDNTGQDNVAESNIFRVAYQAPKPTVPPTPEPTPEPTEAPIIADPNATPEPITPFGGENNNRTGVGTIILYVLAGLFGVIILGVGVLLFMGNRRNAVPTGGPSSPGGGPRQATPTKVIDTIQRVPHRDYSKAATRGKGAAMAAAGYRNAPAAEDMPPLADEGMEYIPSRQYEQQLPPMDQADGPRPAQGYAPVAAGQAARPAMDDDEDASFTSARFRRPDQAPSSATGPNPTVKQEETRAYVPKARPSFTSAYRDDEDDNLSLPDIPDMPEDDDRPRKARKVEAPVEMEPLQVTQPTPVIPQMPTNTDMYRRPEDRGSRQAEPEQETAADDLSTYDEDAALLSGSTGQYRLSRRSSSAATRGRDAAPAGQAEDAESYARKQRASRPRRADLSNLYGDDDDTNNDPTPPRRRR